MMTLKTNAKKMTIILVVGHARSPQWHHHRQLLQLRRRNARDRHRRPHTFQRISKKNTKKR